MEGTGLERMGLDRIGTVVMEGKGRDRNGQERNGRIGLIIEGDANDT